MRWERPEGSIDTTRSTVVYRFPEPPQGLAGRGTVFPSWSAAALGLEGRSRSDPVLMRQDELYYLVSDERSVELTPDGCDYRIRTGWDTASRTRQDLDSCCVVIGDAMAARDFLAPHVAPEALNDLIPRVERSTTFDLEGMVARAVQEAGVEPTSETVAAYLGGIDVEGLQQAISRAVGAYVGRAIERDGHVVAQTERPRVAAQRR